MAAVGRQGSQASGYLNYLPPLPPTAWWRLYPYTADLLTFDLYRARDPELSKALCQVKTPLKVGAWVRALSTHLDRAFAQYVIRGIIEGFRIGFNHACPLRSTSRNMLSAQEHPGVV